MIKEKPGTGPTEREKMRYRAKMNGPELYDALQMLFDAHLQMYGIDNKTFNRAMNRAKSVLEKVRGQ